MGDARVPRTLYLQGSFLRAVPSCTPLLTSEESLDLQYEITTLTRVWSGRGKQYDRPQA